MVGKQKLSQSFNMREISPNLKVYTISYSKIVDMVK